MKSKRFTREITANVIIDIGSDVCVATTAVLTADATDVTIVESIIL